MHILKDLLQESTRTQGGQSFILDKEEGNITYQEADISWKAGAKVITQNFQERRNIGIWTLDKRDAIKAIGSCIYAFMPYIPLDNGSPLSRLKNIIEDAEIKAIWVSTEMKSIVENNFSVAHAYELDGLLLVVLKSEKEKIEPIPPDLAYILYTSGSTGKPKGAMISHKNALAFIDWSVEALELRSDDVFSSIADLHFDLSILDLFSCIKVGGSLVLVEKKHIKFPRSIAEMVQDYSISVMYATPTFYQLWMDYGKLQRFEIGSIRKLLYAGEPFPLVALNQLSENFPEVEIYNLYGPTETNVCLYYALDKGKQFHDQVPIGKATSHMSIMISGETDEGELHASGNSVFLGYWKDKEKTKAVIKTIKGQKWYATGDTARLSSNGNYTFIGRMDRMIKRRGYRIELDEIEEGIRSIFNVNQAAVIAQNSPLSQKSIVAYYTFSNEDVEFNEQDLRLGLLEFIPLYMMPDSFISLEKIPLTSTLKTDYQALSNMLHGK